MISFADPILKFAGNTKETHQMAKDYFIVIMAGIGFTAISQVINPAHRGSGNTQIVFVTNLVSSVVNIFFNYLLIDGHLGFPALGTKGAAIATVLGTVVSTIMCLASLRRGNSYLNFKMMKKEKIEINRTIRKESKCKYIYRDNIYENRLFNNSYYSSKTRYKRLCFT